MFTAIRAGQTETLDALLVARLMDGPDDGECLVCGGETFRVRRRSGTTAEICRSCGSVLEDEVSVDAAFARPFAGSRARPSATERRVA